MGRVAVCPKSVRKGENPTTYFIWPLLRYALESTIKKYSFTRIRQFSEEIHCTYKDILELH